MRFPRSTKAATLALCAASVFTASAVHATSFTTQAQQVRPASSSLAVVSTKDRPYVFGNNSIFRRDLTGAPVDPNSQAMVADLNRQVEQNWGGVAAFNLTGFTERSFNAAPDTPTQNVQFNDCQGKGFVPSSIDPARPGAAFNQVPIPADAEPAPEDDGAMGIYQASTDTLWEFWRAKKNNDGTWSACWGGRIDKVSQSDGTYPGDTGVTASGTAFRGSAVGYEEAKAAVEGRGEINHAVYLAIMEPADYTRVVWPAKRSDGFSTNPNAIPEGSRLRLSPDADLSGLTPLGKAIARAAQRFGFIVSDKAGAVNVSAEHASLAQWESVLQGTPSHQVLKNFPWKQLEVIDHGYANLTPPVNAPEPAPTTSSTEPASGAPTSSAPAAPCPTATATPTSPDPAASSTRPTPDMTIATPCPTATSGPTESATTPAPSSTGPSNPVPSSTQAPSWGSPTSSGSSSDNPTPTGTGPSSGTDPSSTGSSSWTSPTSSWNPSESPTSPGSPGQPWPPAPATPTPTTRPDAWWWLMAGADATSNPEPTQTGGH